MLRQLSITSPTAAGPAAGTASAGDIPSLSSAADDLSAQQQVPDSAAAAAAAAAGSGYTWTAQLELLQADITNPGLISPEPWTALGLNPGCDLAACIEVLEHLEPQAVQALGHSVLGALSPKTALFTTPNWEYNEVLRRVLGPGLMWPGPPGRNGKPLRHGDHK